MYQVCEYLRRKFHSLYENDYLVVKFEWPWDRLYRGFMTEPYNNFF